MKTKTLIIICNLLPIFSGCNSIFAQSKFVAHEWGTFTTIQSSNGKVLSGMGGETLPKFVYDMNLRACKTCYKGMAGKTTLKNITVQMETPIIYFYYDKEMDVDVSVKFANGIINQYYPDRNDGEATPDEQEIDLEKGRTGWINWKAKILTAKDTPSIKQHIYPDYEMEHEWTSPRGTNSNLVKTKNGDIEKFIFYRGLANFEVPFKAEFNKDTDIVVTNNFDEDLGYVMIYDLEGVGKYGSPTVWWSGSMNKGEMKVIKKPAKSSTFAEIDNELINFKNNLVKAGLTVAEANSMLQTWYKSKFGYFLDFSNRFKIFWIAPRSFVDKVLPISISPTPTDLQRVFIGRSELFSPEFEKELTDLTDSAFVKDYRFSDARYKDVFANYRQSGKDTTAVNPKDTTKTNNATNIIHQTSSIKHIIVMPNPFEQSFIISCIIEQTGFVETTIVDMNGKMVFELKDKTTAGVYQKEILLNTLATGTYFATVRNGERVWSSKIVKR